MKHGSTKFRLAMEIETPKGLAVFLLVCLILVLIQCAVAQGVPLSSATEHQALLNLRSSLGLRARDWPRKADPCSRWTGVSCTNGRVIGINVSGLERTRIGRRNPSFNANSLVNLTKLVSFNASGFFLPGPIPGWFGSRLSTLQVLDLRSCGLSGSIPASLGNLSRLHSLYLCDNKLAGSIPDALWSMPKLQFLDLSSNNLTGELTSHASSTYITAAVFNLSNNFLYGPLNFQFGIFKFIDLSGNYFEGAISDDNVTNAAVDKNCLKVVANQRPFDDCRLFYTERGLHIDYFEPPPHPGNRKRWIFILAGVLGGLGFVAILVLLLILLLRRCNWRITNQSGNPNGGPVPEGDSSQLQKFSVIVSGSGKPFTHEQLFRATEGFSEMYLMKHGHSGDIFRGILESGTTIVIKRVSLPSVEKESYKVELDLFNKLLHMRFVPILGHCLEHEYDKLFVYKYMPNGDLATFFHRTTNSEDDSMQPLDWITRLKIAIGAAEGLSYLHHECNPPLVHRDVQASSILLDNKFEVRLGSLSEVCVQGGDSHQNVLTRFMQKPQTSEPAPSGQSPANCAYDVYCFGKVLLELITGKLGISRTDDASTKEWLEQTLACISLNDKELVTKIMDPSLIVDEDLLEEVWAMAVVAKSCLHSKPSKRPPMKHILKALENPLKVVRKESFSSLILRTTSSRKSWNATIVGSWRQNSSGSGNVLGHTNKESVGGSKQLKRTGTQSSSGNIDRSSSHKRLSNEVFPEPTDVQEMEGPAEH
ncbi:hypothetical protein SLEP1_g16953 [Rubroshorea leprosula]|uniref:Protein kinase domain-containing protein n=1 Tax=Rubroshorea leprosula TaxID=152421 RepID=A0AAV5J475_9ROSI|nr:hypothetical protein SLEP1_g16953 [Rubroshorea leprosula]